VVVKPAEVDTGVVFYRDDLPDEPEVPATPKYLEENPRRTALRNGNAEVHTVEHFFAALMGLGLDNLEVHLDGPEMPGLDGSALPFFEALEAAGVQEQKAPKATFKVIEPLSVTVGDSMVTIVPHAQEGLTLAYTLDYPGTLVGSQYFAVEVNRDRFRDDIAPARTFVLESEVEQLREEGLGLGADLENTLVIRDCLDPARNGSEAAESAVAEVESAEEVPEGAELTDTPATEDAVPETGNNGSQECLTASGSPLRFKDELVRHKILDLMGDLYLAGVDLEGRVLATKSGHAANRMMVKELIKRIEEQENVSMTAVTGMDIKEMLTLLPHRYPFLLIDRVLKLEGYRRAVGIKNVTINEPFFQGHFPEQPIMPGVLILEAMAQLAGLLLLRRLENTGKLAMLWSIDKVKLRRAVVPGDQLRIEIEATKVRSKMGQGAAVAKVGGVKVAEALLTFTLVDAE